ncbi:hypothetical protein ACWTU6_30625 [Mesorhizobium sp. BHbsci]
MLDVTTAIRQTQHHHAAAPSADREEKRVTHKKVQKKVQEHLDQNDLN